MNKINRSINNVSVQLNLQLGLNFTTHPSNIIRLFVRLERNLIKSVSIKFYFVLIILNLGKYTEIERENKILLEKMSNIMQDTKPNLYNPSK
jgi:hypothetical protein